MRSKLAWQAALATLAIALLTARGVTTGDDAVHLALAVAIVERGESTLAIDPGELWVPSRPVAGGLFYQAEDGLRSASSPAFAWMSLPLVAIGSALAEGPLELDALFRESTAPPEVILRPIAADPRAIAISLVAPIGAALAVFFSVLAMRELALPRRARLAGACALALGSPLFVYAGSCWTQVPACALVALLAWRLCAREARSGASIAPLSLGAASLVLVRPDLAPIAVASGAALYLIERRWRRSPSRALARFVVPLAIALSVVALWLPAPGGGFSIARIPEGALGLAASARTGLAVYAPFTLVALFGFPKLPAPIRLAFAAWIIGALLAYGGWFDWPSSLAYGPRLLVPVLPPLAIALGCTFDRHRAITSAAIALGLAIQLPGALLAHVRIDEPDGFFSPAIVSAWRALGHGPIDSGSAYQVFYPTVALVVCVAGMAVSYAAGRSEEAC